MYKSPIDLLMSNIHTQIIEQQEEAIYKAVMDIGVNVDKGELIRALDYDRQQYKKGYADAMQSIVRCKDCKHAVVAVPPLVAEQKLVCTKSVNWRAVEQDHFCSYGERREGE